jgi:prolipoprotein diacylglyceryltransferase
VPPALIVFEFDPLLRLMDGFAVRWETIALAVVLAVCLAAAGVAARRSALRADDLLYIAIGAVPGAVVAGRIGYAIIVPEAFASGPAGLVDPSIGGMELGLGVAGGIATGSLVASLLGAPVGRWAHLLAVPLLVAIAGGKAAMALGGSGQGALSDAAWSTAYLGVGPWGSLAPDLPSHPAQLYEALAGAVVIVGVVVATSAGVFRTRDGSRLLVGVAAWATVRAAVSVTWRDPSVVAGLPAGGALAVAIAIGAVMAALLLGVWLPRRIRTRAAAAKPVWPDPDARPRF